MIYQVCPRCQFKIALNKHVCGTCGLNIAAHNAQYRQNAAKNPPLSKANTNLSTWFSSFGAKPKEASASHEEPALGET